jgi:acetoin utilization protein AcuB
MRTKPTVNAAVEERYGTVSNWMTREPVMVTEESSLGAALARMRKDEIQHLLVMDGDRLSGIVSNRDVRKLATEDPGARFLSEPVSRIMTENPITVTPETGIAVAVRLLLELRIGALPVRQGQNIVGIFTTADALEALLAMMERPGA